MTLRLALICAFLLLSVGSAASQTADTLTVDDGWRSKLIGSATANQATYNNWQAGGINAFAFGALVDGAFDKVFGRVLTLQEARASFALLKQDTLDVRKADDVLRYGISAELTSSGILHPSASFSARSQAVSGFDYSPSAADYPTLTVTPGQQLKVSDFFSPATFTQSLGVAIRPGGGFLGRAGFGAKETVVSIARLRPLYGNAADQQVRSELGLDAMAQYDREVFKNVRLLSRATAFQAFNQAGNVAPDVIWENILSMKVNDFLNVTFEAATLYDADISADLQYKQVLAVGFLYSIL